MRMSEKRALLKEIRGVDIDCLRPLSVSLYYV